MAGKMIRPDQVKKIHALKGALGLDDATYRAALFDAFKVESSKLLSAEQAAAFLASLEEKAVAAGRWVRRGRPAETRRVGFATPAQLDLIERLWEQVSTAPQELRQRALRKFVARQAKVSDLRFLRDGDASRVICALKAMADGKTARISGR